MAVYPGLIGGNIGNLLRMIREEKANTPIVPPAAEAGAPIREATGEPVINPESPGTSRQVSIRPEMTLPVSPESPGVMNFSGVPRRARVGSLAIGGGQVAGVSAPGQPVQAGVSAPAQMGQPSVGIATRIVSPTPAQRVANITAENLAWGKPGGQYLKDAEKAKELSKKAQAVSVTPTLSPQQYAQAVSGAKQQLAKTYAAQPTPTQKPPQPTPTPAPKKTTSAPITLPSLGTIISGGLGQAIKKAKNWKW